MNTTDLSLYLLIAAGSLVFLALWAMGVAAAVWDTGRRGMRGPERWFWVALPVVLPIAGLIVYATIQITARLTAGAPSTSQPPPRRRLTQPLPEASAGDVRTTIPAAEARSWTPPPTVADLSSAPPGGDSWRLAVIAGPDAGASFDQRYLPAVIGRSAAAAICLGGDLNVSRQHAEIYGDPAALRVRDLNSRHGTQVNGVPIQDQSLYPGDRVQLGATVLLLERRAG